MTGALIFATTGVLLFTMGSVATLLPGPLVHRILGFNLMGSGAFLALVSLAQRGGDADPVPHAMVLTGIVVAVTATALALALVRRLNALTGEERLPEDRDD